jgi:hypothetical protein
VMTFPLSGEHEEAEPPGLLEYSTEAGICDVASQHDTPVWSDANIRAATTKLAPQS